MANLIIHDAYGKCVCHLTKVDPKDVDRIAAPYRAGSPRPERVTVTLKED